MLTARSVSKAFGGHRAVDGVSLSVERGTITGLIGPNGAGKTTLFNCIAGALPLSSGEIELDGRRIDNIGADRIFSRGLARTFQIPRPFPDMSVLENVMLALPKQSGELFYMNWLAPRRVAREEQAAKASARRWIEFVGLSHLQHEPARVLSGGQRKLLELARVLVAEPKLILLDEPAAGVNPALLDIIIEKIVALNQQGVTFLIIEHNMDMVLSLCHPLHVLAEGKLLMSGDAADVRGDPRVIDAYLGGAAT